MPICLRQLFGEARDGRKLSEWLTKHFAGVCVRSTCKEKQPVIQGGVSRTVYRVPTMTRPRDVGSVDVGSGPSAFRGGTLRPWPVMSVIPDPVSPDP